MSLKTRLTRSKCTPPVIDTRRSRKGRNFSLKAYMPSTITMRELGTSIVLLKYGFGNNDNQLTSAKKIKSINMNKILAHPVRSNKAHRTVSSRKEMGKKTNRKTIFLRMK